MAIAARKADHIVMITSGMAPVSLLPDAIRALGLRLGGSNDATLSSVILTQSGKMRDPPAGHWMDFRARQHIAINQPGFSWKARTGPLGCITVVDALADGDGDLAVRLFGVLPIAHVRKSEAVNRGEMLRYLAELAWAPDAILRNRELSWSIRSENCFIVSAGNASLDIEINADGRIGAVRADRPRTEGATFVTRPWRGRFSDYRRVYDRWIPYAAEVAWVLNDTLQLAWRGTLTSWAMI